mgnify:CR=1 FL=1
MGKLEEAAEELRADWERMLPDVPLVIVETPYRSLVVPFLHYLDVMAPTPPDTITVVVLPEYVPRHFWDRILYNQTAKQLKNALVGRPETVVADVPYGSKHLHTGISFRGVWRRSDDENAHKTEHADEAPSSSPDGDDHGDER